MLRNQDDPKFDKKKENNNSRISFNMYLYSIENINYIISFMKELKLKKLVGIMGIILALQTKTIHLIQKCAQDLLNRFD